MTFFHKRGLFAKGSCVQMLHVHSTSQHRKNVAINVATTKGAHRMNCAHAFHLHDSVRFIQRLTGQVSKFLFEVKSEESAERPSWIYYQM